MASCGVSPTWSKLSESEQNQGQVALAVWQVYWDRVAKYPCYSKFEPVLRYDLLQFLNTMRYSHLVNGRPYLLNMAEHDVYTPHNMMMVSFATLDLMCSPTFTPADVGALRECVWHAQSMGRIGNLLSTWKRELADRDFTSGVFARALANGEVTLDTLERAEGKRTRGCDSRWKQRCVFSLPMVRTSTALSCSGSSRRILRTRFRAARARPVLRNAPGKPRADLAFRWASRSNVRIPAKAISRALHPGDDVRHARVRVRDRRTMRVVRQSDVQPLVAYSTAFRDGRHPGHRGLPPSLP